MGLATISVNSSPTGIAAVGSAKVGSTAYQQPQDLYDPLLALHYHTHSYCTMLWEERMRKKNQPS